jgi:hypothetical protein
MKITNRSDVGRRSMASRAKSLSGVGLGAALLLAGFTFVGVLPAAATAASLSFTSPPSSVTANTGTTFTVAFSAAASGDTITLSSTNCTLAPSGNLVYTTSGTSGNATFTSIILSAASTGSCALTATDAPTGGTATATVTVTPAAANKIVFSTEPASTTAANTPVPFTVKTEDTYGDLETASTDSVSVVSSCPLTGATPVTEVGGVASFTTVGFTSTGSCYLTATDTTAALTPVVSTLVTVTGGTPAKLAFTTAPPTTVAATATIVTTFKVSVEDAAGNVDTAGTGSTDVVSISSPCLAAAVPATAVAGVATFSTVEFATTGACVLTATDTSRVIAAATANVQVGTPQAAIAISSKSGYLDAPLTLIVTGGSGTGAVTFVVTNGTATGCTITNGVLSATTAGTCVVTANKAAVAPYATGTSGPITITISSAPKAVRVVGSVTKGKKSTITVTGYNFSGRPKVTSNVAGFKATVTRDSGKTLTLSITVTGASKPGVKVLALAFANGKHATVKYSLRG